MHRLSEIGVRDSKMLSDKRRSSLFDDIESIAEEVKVDKIYPAEINDAMRNNISLNELEAVHFARLFDMMDGVVNAVYLDSPDVIAEKFGVRFNMSSTKFTRVVGVKGTKAEGAGAITRPVRIISEHKADSRYPIVSAASIIAKVTRDKEIKRLERSLKIKLGSGYPSDKATIDAVKGNLKNPILIPYIREYWKTVENIKQTRLTNFAVAKVY